LVVLRLVSIRKSYRRLRASRTINYLGLIVLVPVAQFGKPTKFTLGKMANQYNGHDKAGLIMEFTKESVEGARDIARLIFGRERESELSDDELIELLREALSGQRTNGR